MEQSTVNAPAAQAKPPVSSRELAFARYLKHSGRADALRLALSLLADVQTGTLTVDSVITTLTYEMDRDRAVANASAREATYVAK